MDQAHGNPNDHNEAMKTARAKYWAVCLLLALYVIQAVPMGISAALPLSLQGRGASYTDLAKFTFASLPFTLKLFWAPIVDSTHLPNHGRRKSWLVPVQLCCAALMIIPASFGWTSRWAGEHNPRQMAVVPLTIYFFLLYTFMATQDIAVDGWALEILPPNMKKHASTCNTIGQSLGFYLTNIAFLIFNHSRDLNSPDDKTPVFEFVKHINISLDAFLRFWGIVLALLTLYVAFFVPESKEIVELRVSPSAKSADALADERRQSPIGYSYMALAKMLTLRPVILAIILLMFCRMPFGPVDSSGGLKMLETGCAKELLALIAPFAFPCGIITSYLTGRWINKKFSALRAFEYGYALRLALCLIWLCVYRVSGILNGGRSSIWGAVIVYGLILVGICLQTVATELMFVSQMAFFAQVADTAMGGTYMTFFNTMANLGNKWPSLVSLALMDKTSFLTGDTFIDLTLAATMLGALIGYPFGVHLLHMIEKTDKQDWLLSKKDLRSTPRQGEEESFELIKGAPGADSPTNRLASRVASSVSRV